MRAASGSGARLADGAGSALHLADGFFQLVAAVTVLGNELLGLLDADVVGLGKVAHLIVLPPGDPGPVLSAHVVLVVCHDYFPFGGQTGLIRAGSITHPTRP